MRTETSFNNLGLIISHNRKNISSFYIGMHEHKYLIKKKREMFHGIHLFDRLYDHQLNNLISIQISFFAKIV